MIDPVSLLYLLQNLHMVRKTADLAALRSTKTSKHQGVELCLTFKVAKLIYDSKSTCANDDKIWHFVGDFYDFVARMSLMKRGSVTHA